MAQIARQLDNALALSRELAHTDLKRACYFARGDVDLVAVIVKARALLMA